MPHDGSDAASTGVLTRLHQPAVLQRGVPYHPHRCIDLQDRSAALWMLGHASLQDCRLVKTGQDAGSASYRLQCDGGHGTTGDAHWQFDADRMTGTLRVRLGGKNMTFHQRITATAAKIATGC